MENYRSTPNILRVATQVIGQNEVSPEFPKKVLQPNQNEGEKIRIVEMETPEDEAAWVAEELERLHGAGRRWRDFAVLYRQHAHRDHLVEELSRRKIPFVISKLSILEHPLVRDVLAYLHLIAMPFDDIACARVLSAPAWHLTPEDLVRLTERARQETRHGSLRRAAGAAIGVAVRCLAWRDLRYAAGVFGRATQDDAAANGAGNSGRSGGVAGSAAARRARSERKYSTN